LLVAHALHVDQAYGVFQIVKFKIPHTTVGGYNIIYHF